MLNATLNLNAMTVTELNVEEFIKWAKKHCLKFWHHELFTAMVSSGIYHYSNQDAEDAKKWSLIIGMSNSTPEGLARVTGQRHLPGYTNLKSIVTIDDDWYVRQSLKDSQLLIKAPEDTCGIMIECSLTSLTPLMNPL